LAGVLFLELDQENQWAVASIGPAFITGYLREHDHNVSMLRVPVDMSTAHLIDKLKDKKPDVLGVSLTSRQWLRVKELIPALRERLDIIVIAGGLHPTFESDLVLETPGFDYVCIGEGEQAMLEFVQAYESGDLPSKKIKNIRGKDDPMPDLRPPFEPFDQLPFMARDMLQEQTGIVHMETQRGCPFRCSYCAGRNLSDLYDGSYASYGRRRSVSNVLKELSQLRDSGAVNYVVFLDDTFTIKHSWVNEFCEHYSKDFHIPFSINARAETVNKKLLIKLAEAGCMHIIYGVESGSDRVRRDILKRNVSNEHLVDVFRWTQEAGMLATANYMLGIPGETKPDVELTLQLHQELQPDDFGYFVFYPYPGTELYRVCREKGYLPKNYYDLPANNRKTILNLPELTQEDIDEYYDRFTQLRIRDRLNILPKDIDPIYRDKIIADVEHCASQG
jgi:radical SAM superfamily enzyme YgiQ (UPF0313 family)